MKKIIFIILLLALISFMGSGIMGGCIQQPIQQPTQQPTQQPIQQSIQQPIVRDCSHVGDKEWRIIKDKDDIACSNKEIILNGDLIISGTLVFDNITLIMNSKQNKEYKIEVLDTGNFSIINSRITVGNPEYGYQFYYKKGSAGFIDNSIIEHTARGEDILNTKGEGGAGGLSIFTDNFVLKNSIIRNSKGRGVLFGAAKNILILNNTFADNFYDGCRIYDSENAILANNIGYDNNEYAIKLMHSKNIIIVNNTAKNNKRDGIHLHTCEDVLIEKNTAFDNGWSGIKIGPGIYSGYKSGSSRIFVNNNIVSRNKGQGIESLTIADSEISENIVEENLLNGISVQWLCANTTLRGNRVTKNNNSGIVVIESDNITLSNNEITNNGDTGIVFESSHTSKTQNNIIKNHGFNGPMSGIFLFNSTDITLSNDYIENSTACGIDMRFSTPSIINPTIVSSDEYDICGRENSFPIVAGCNECKIRFDETSSIGDLQVK